MIVSFSIENWMSFRNLTSFSMVASRERQHGDRIPTVIKYKAKVLPIAAIYGGNASGKTNFFKALNFVKLFVTQGTKPDSLIPVRPYRLHNDSLEKPSCFKLELLVDDVIYEFGFSVTTKAVIEEKLVKITNTNEKTLYHRKDNKPNFDASLNKDEFLHFAFKGTRDNQLFLTNAISQKVETFRPVYDWFNETLGLIAPDSRFGSFEHFLDEGHPLYNTMNQMLPLLDTGISHLGGEEVSFDNAFFPENLKIKLQEEVKENASVRIMSSNNERFIVTRRNGRLIAKKLVTFHRNANGEETKFEMHHESDGTQRVIDLLPAFLEVSADKSTKVYIIDEVDRSLHTLLTRQLIESYLEKCGAKSRAQLLITTHDILLMDQNLFRRDEMWVAERGMEGSSNLLSFSDYKGVRYDKDIRKSYLQGRLGGIPRISYK